MPNRNLTGPMDDRYTRQREAGFPGLRFAPELEREYRDSFADLNLMRIRLAGALALVAIFSFILVDSWLGSNLEPAGYDWLLLAFCGPASLLTVVATYLERLRPYLLSMLQMSVLLVSTGVLVAVVLNRQEQTWFPYESLVLVTVYIYFVAGLMLYQAIFCGSALLVGFVASNWSLQQHSILLYEIFYLLVANAMGWVGLYLLERQARMQYLLRHELRQQAAIDSLTGLLNHRGFNGHLEMAWLQAQRALTSVGLMVVDLDHFKRINDTAGHPFGDKALQHVAQALKSCALRPLDAAGRYGGDELIAMWYGVDGAFLQKLTEELPKKLEGLTLPDGTTPVTVSGGAVVAWPRPGLTVKEAVKAADDLLYEVKRSTRGRIAFKVLRPPQAEAANQTAAA